MFVRYSGSRKGKPFSQGWVREQLNKLAFKKNITDEMGNLFHFKSHQFRQTTLWVGFNEAGRMNGDISC